MSRINLNRRNLGYHIGSTKINKSIDSLLILKVIFGI
jgi:hypothetical protein